jgi:hypothetical protein
MVARQGGDAELVCWNYKQVMDVIFSVSGVVVCCISGQQLDGGYSVDDMTRKGRGRVHHIAIRNAITEPSDKACFGILEFFENSIVLQGYGGVNSITVSCPTEEEAKNIHAREVAQVAQVKAEAELLRHREVFAAKQANEQVLKEAMEKEEEAALAVDAENRRLWLIAEEAAALERKREQERLAAFYAGEAGEKLGLKWEEVGADKPHSGAEIKNAALYAALREKLEFTKEEFKRFQVGNVTHTSYIKVDTLKARTYTLQTSVNTDFNKLSFLQERDVERLYQATNAESFRFLVIYICACQHARTSTFCGCISLCFTSSSPSRWTTCISNQA